VTLSSSSFSVKDQTENSGSSRMLRCVNLASVFLRVVLICKSDVRTRTLLKNVISPTEHVLCILLVANMSD